MSGYIHFSLATLLAQDPALAASDPRVVDNGAVPGDFSVAAGTRVMRGKVVVGMSEFLITHPDITLASMVNCSWEGNASASPEATKRGSCRPVLSGIVVSLSSAALASDGPFEVKVDAV